jgi:hypothetical protein
MSIHTRLVGAFDGLILSLTAAVNIVVLATLLNPSLALSEIASRRGTVTIQQIAMDDVATAIRYV